MDELHHAMLEFNVPEVADAIADLIYVLLGTAVTYGIDIGPIWDAVHAANMAKSGGRQREDGKWEKPAGWRPPDIDGLLRQQGWEG
jgi:predicted HAD superfamily Cof-like phosphohydrolase